MEKFYEILGAIIAFAVLALLFSLLLMTAWNYVILDIIDTDVLNEINYLQSLVLYLAITFVFGNITFNGKNN